MKNSGQAKTQMITVVGTIGAGKSTAMPLITKAVDGHAVDADSFFITNNPFRDDYLGDLPRWALANEIWLTLERAEMLRRERIEAEKKGKKWMVVDSGLVMSYAYMKMHLVYHEVVEAEWRLFERIFEQVNRDNGTDVVVWLDVSTETAMERMKKRGRGYELENYDKRYLGNLRKAVAGVVERLEHEGVEIVRLGEDIGNIVDNGVDRRKLEKLVALRFRRIGFLDLQVDEGM